MVDTSSDLFSKWLESGLSKLDLRGRDEFYTHLIVQEVPVWLSLIRQEREVDQSEVEWIVRRRGFNRIESARVRALAKFLNSNADEIRARCPDPS